MMVELLVWLSELLHKVADVVDGIVSTIYHRELADEYYKKEEVEK